DRVDQGGRPGGTLRGLPPAPVLGHPPLRAFRDDLHGRACAGAPEPLARRGGVSRAASALGEISRPGSGTAPEHAISPRARVPLRRARPAAPLALRGTGGSHRARGPGRSPRPTRHAAPRHGSPPPPD